MRIRASDGKFYNPDISTLIGVRTLPDGTIQRLHRTKVGAYFFYSFHINGEKKTLTPTTYDEALEWAEKYGDKEMVDTYMNSSADQLRHFTVQLTERNLSRLELIAKENCMTIKDVIHLLVTEYERIHNGGVNDIEKE